MSGLPAVHLVRGSIALLAFVLGLVATWLHARAVRSDRAAFGGEPKRTGPSRTLILLRVLTLILLAAAASTEGRYLPEPPRAVERPLVIVVDVSMSMKATDVLPSRLEEAKRWLRAVLPQAAGRRAAVVAFAGTASLVCPLTSDFDALGVLLEEASEEVAAPGPTRVVVALGRAFALLGETPGDVLVVSDGEFSDGPADTLRSDRRQVARHHRVSAVGVGTTGGAPVPRRGNSAPDGTTDPSRLDEGRLRELAAQGGGTYLRMTANTELSLRTLFPSAAPPDRALVVQMLEAMAPADGVLAAGVLLLLIETWVAWGTGRERV